MTGPGTPRPRDPLAGLADEVGPPGAGPVVAVGGRTQWDVGGPVDDVAREVHPPAGIVRVDAADMVVRVRAGTTVGDLDAGLAEVGQTVALPARPGATVGGVLAVGRSGLRRLGWGHVRDTLLEVRAVSADGRLVTAGGPTVKNVSGYDLCRLLVGSLGTLAIIGEVVLRTRPLPATERWVAGPADPLELLRRLHRPAAVLWDGTTTWVLLDGHPDDVEAQAALTGLPPADGPPALPPHRWSMRPSEIGAIAADGGRFVAEVGVGVVHHELPPPPRPVAPHVVDLHQRVKAAFDPTGRLAPGRDPLARTTVTGSSPTDSPTDSSPTGSTPAAPGGSALTGAA
ncbi:MAG: FAD-binding oxidoreductase [Acidimicrobiia bacterium]